VLLTEHPLDVNKKSPNLSRRRFVSTSSAAIALPIIMPNSIFGQTARPNASHLGQISMLAGRKIKWDVAKEEIIGDADASKLLTREYRAPWKPG
jgi:hypothetical protein